MVTDLNFFFALIDANCSKIHAWQKFTWHIVDQFVKTETKDHTLEDLTCTSFAVGYQGPVLACWHLLWTDYPSRSLTLSDWSMDIPPIMIDISTFPEGIRRLVFNLAILRCFCSWFSAEIANLKVSENQILKNNADTFLLQQNLTFQRQSKTYWKILGNIEKYLKILKNTWK